jgi:hypothetical protein
LANDSKIEGSKTPLTIYKNEENRIRLDQHFKTARQTGTNVELKLWSKTSGNGSGVEHMPHHLKVKDLS